MRTVLVLLIVSLAGTPLIGQIPPATAANADDFRRLFEEREKLLGERRELEKSIEELSGRTRNLPSVESLERGLAKANRDLERSQKSKTPDPVNIDFLQRQIETTSDDLAIAKSAMPLLKAQRDQYETVGTRLFQLEQRIASLFDASRDVNKFRSNVTYTFGVLVFVVIVGFYFIAWYKQGVATTIFSGAMGMQFVTLFLIVIAIILFGIMGTLEGKELAALLGGLSGYILGRADSRRERSTPEEESAGGSVNATP